MRIIYPQISKLSQLEIDADKDWNGRKVSNMGELEIKKDTADAKDGFLKLVIRSSAGSVTPVTFHNSDGSLQALIHSGRGGDIALSPNANFYPGHSELNALPKWYTPDMHWGIPLRRMMLINAVVFGG